MSFKKERRPVLFRAGSNYSTQNQTGSTGAFIAENVQALTGASTGTAITNFGMTVITVTTGEGTAADLIYTLNAPAYKGRRKVIVADLNSTKTVRVVNPSTANTFYGTTKNSFLFSTGSTYAPSSLELLSNSSVQWVILNAETALGFSTSATPHKVSIAGSTLP